MTRVSGPIVFMTTTGYGFRRTTATDLLWISVALAGREVVESG